MNGALSDVHFEVMAAVFKESKPAPDALKFAAWKLALDTIMADFSKEPGFCAESFLAKVESDGSA